MEQGTSEWLEWRRKGIGASESAALLGVCPYKTALMLYKEKTGGQAEDTESSAGLFQAGHETEAHVRAAYEFETGLDFPPALFEHPEFPFIRASLDGWNEETRAGIEIKLVGREKFEGPIPEHHLIQMQHQMLVTATDTWTYLRHCGGETKVETVALDKDIQMKLLGACWQFWDDVLNKRPPAPTDRDWVETASPALGALLVDYAGARTTKQRTMVREAIFASVEWNRTICDGWRIARDTRRITAPKEA